MDYEKTLEKLKHMKVETGSFVCMGCGHEHNCSIRGCAILRDTVECIEELKRVLQESETARAELGRRLAAVQQELAAYKDTGLEPEEIKNALDVNDIIPEINVTVDHIRDLLKAEQDGRLVALPFQQGKTLIDRTFPENPQLMENVRVAVAYDSMGIIFHYPFNDFIQNVESGCIFQVSGETETMLAGRDSMQSDAPKETAETEWKNRVMRTFLGGRGT